jgi:hypothetical protein
MTAKHRDTEAHREIKHEMTELACNHSHRSVDRWTPAAYPIVGALPCATVYLWLIRNAETH